MSCSPVSQKKPKNREFKPSEKRTNVKLSRTRVRIEHAISGIKRCRCLKDTLRNTRDGFSDLIMVNACGLHNLRVHFRKRALRKSLRPYFG